MLQSNIIILSNMINLRRADEKSLQDRPISGLYYPNLNAHYRSFRFSSNNACDMAYNIYIKNVLRNVNIFIKYVYLYILLRIALRSLSLLFYRYYSIISLWWYLVIIILATL